jgi:adenylate cyclase
MALASGAQSFLYRFRGFTLDLGRGTLSSADGTEIRLRAKSFALLRFLVENSGRLVPREEIMEVLWPGIFVTDDNISQCVRDIRGALRTGTGEILRTVPRRGYLFAVEVVAEPTSARPASSPEGAGIHQSAIGGTDGEVPIAADMEVQPPRPETPANLPLTGRPSIAVLAFESLSNDQNQKPFLDSVADDIITELSRNRSVLVAAKSSSFAYRGRSPDIRRIARELGVDYIVDGSVRSDGGRVRITARLIDAPTGVHVWIEQFDVAIGNGTFSVDEMTGRMARVLSVKLNEDVNRRIEAMPQRDWTPDVLVMRGHAYNSRPTSEAHRHEAIRCYEQALDGDPDSIDARLGIAWVLIANIVDFWSRSPARDLARAEQLLLDVLHVDDDIAQAHTLMGIVRRAQGRLDESRLELEKAIELVPNSPQTICQLGQTLEFLGRPDAAIPHIERSLRLAPHDPATPTFYFALGACHVLLEHIEEAITCFRKALTGNPRYSFSHLGLAAALGLNGELDEAAAAMRQAIEIEPEIASLASLRALPWLTNPRFVVLFEKTYCAGLRRAGLPDE